MRKAMFRALVGAVAVGFSAGVSAQSFVTDVTIVKPGTGSARYRVQNDEGSGALVVDNARMTLELPSGTGRVVLSGGNLGVGVVPLQKLHLFQSGTAGSRLRLQNGEGHADFGTNDGLMQMFVNNALAATVNASGSMRLTGQMSTTVLEIRGGADLSENFDVNGDIPVLPGMLVSIDPDHAGKLAVSRENYDTKVAGVLSGAGGLNTGMIMSQQGSDVAHGDYPVALTGRVYCYVDADFAAVRPGDLLTTSTTPGHAMKVMDPARASGATIGKAMTALESGKGLVLVLVNLH